ncbi:MAG: PPOX class F420-dependent oxidoreductase [Mycobacterium sp.]
MGNLTVGLQQTFWKGSIVGAFTERELAYLSEQPLMRFASASPTGLPDVAAVAFSVDGNDIVTAGFDITKTVRYRNVQSNPRATVVIDDLASREPWTPRGVKVRGAAGIEEDGGGQRFRIRPEVIWSWGINDPKPGIPQIERRSVS